MLIPVSVLQDTTNKPSTSRRPGGFKPDSLKTVMGNALQNYNGLTIVGDTIPKRTFKDNLNVLCMLIVENLGYSEQERDRFANFFPIYFSNEFKIDDKGYLDKLTQQQLVDNLQESLLFLSSNNVGDNLPDNNSCSEEIKQFCGFLRDLNINYSSTELTIKSKINSIMTFFPDQISRVAPQSQINSQIQAPQFPE